MDVRGLVGAANSNVIFNDPLRLQRVKEGVLKPTPSGEVKSTPSGEVKSTPTGEVKSTPTGQFTDYDVSFRTLIWPPDLLRGTQPQRP